MILFPADFPKSRGGVSQNHEAQNHGEVVYGWASDNHKVHRTPGKVFGERRGMSFTASHCVKWGNASLTEN